MHRKQKKSDFSFGTQPPFRLPETGISAEQCYSTLQKLKEIYLMKILFFSDIHGVPATLEKLFSYLPTLQPNRLVLLGDALYHGPRNGVPVQYDPKQVVTLLNARKNDIIAVRGNCDAEVDQMLLEFPIMADFSELVTDSVRMFLTHGHRWNENNLPPMPQGTVLVHGHTHIPMLKKLDCGLTIFNPGSISLPKQNFPQTFGFFDGTTFTVRKLEDGSILF